MSPTPPRPAQTTTGRGLGHQHQQDRARLLAAHHDGSPCSCLGLNDCGPACPCRVAGHGLPMYRDPSLNPDGAPLEADHTTARSRGGRRPDRLLLRVCNRSRGAGDRGDAAPTTRPTWWTREWYPLPAAPARPPTSSREPRAQRMVVVLCGPAGAGKTTAAHQSGLAVYDRDDDQWTSESQFTAALAELADDPHARAVVIRSAATSSARAKAVALVGATHVYLLTASTAELGRRVAHRNRADKDRGLASIRTWFDRHDRDDGVQLFPGWPAVATVP